MEGLVLRRHNYPPFFSTSDILVWISTTDGFSSRDFFPSETVVSFRWTLMSAKFINRESPANFPHGFLTKFPQRILFLSPSESPSKRITTTSFLVFSKIPFGQESSQQILLAVASTIYSSEPFSENYIKLLVRLFP